MVASPATPGDNGLAAGVMGAEEWVALATIAGYEVRARVAFDKMIEGALTIEKPVAIESGYASQDLSAEWESLLAWVPRAEPEISIFPSRRFNSTAWFRVALVVNKVEPTWLREVEQPARKARAKFRIQREREEAFWQKVEAEVVADPEVAKIQAEIDSTHQHLDGLEALLLEKRPSGTRKERGGERTICSWWKKGSYEAG